MDKVVNIYRKLSIIPALLDAKLSSQGQIVSSLWSQRNLEKSKSTKFLKHLMLYSDLTTDFELQPIDVSSELLTKWSPSEKYKAVLRDADDKQYLEIWQQQNLYRTVDLNALDIHGKVYCDGDFQSFDWSPNESKLLYVAEKKPLESKPFYQRKSKSENALDKKIMVGQEYNYVQDWGEQMVGKKQSVIAEYDVENDTVQILEGIPEDVAPGQVKYSSNGEYIVGVAYSITPRKLGLIFCNNRSSAIFKLKEGQYDVISTPGKAAKSPFFAPSGESILYIERDADGPHNAAVALIQRSFPQSTLESQKILIEVVEEELAITNGKKFYGLFQFNICKRCWASNNRLIFSTSQKTTVNSYVLDLNSGKITELQCTDGNLIVLDVQDDILLANRRNVLIPDVLVISKLPPEGSEHSISWKELTPSKKLPEFETFKYEYMDLTHNDEDSVKNFTAIYVGPSNGSEKSVPLIVYPHGGPHAAFANNFALDYSFLLSNGYALLLVNYRGSTGAGDKSCRFLLDRIGVSDVSDCILATDKALEKFPWLDSSNLALCGGSHGGFLVTHLSGQYPDKFKAVVSRNPVIDVASMSIFSDIPDWCYAESGSEYSQKGAVNDELLLKMRKNSPIVHAHKVKAPTMLQIGSQDLRVPPGQSFEYYHRLKANGVNVKMHLYEDNHSLSQVKYEMDNLINTVLWLNEHTKREASN